MTDMQSLLTHWQLDLHQLREHMYSALTPRERERWHALWLLAPDWSAAQVASALDRDPHTIGAWLDAFRHKGPAALAVEHSGGSPAPSTRPPKLR